MPAVANAFDDVSRLNSRLAKLRVPGGLALGVEVEGGVLDVSATASAMGAPAPRDMDDLVQNGSGAQVQAVLDAAATRPEARMVMETAEVRFAPLVAQPEKIICIGSPQMPMRAYLQRLWFGS